MDQPTYSLTSFMVNQVAKIAGCLGVLEARAKTGSPKQPLDSASISTSQMIAGNTPLWELVTASWNNNLANKAGCKPQKIHNVAQAYAELESYSPYEIQDLLQAHRLLMVDLVPHLGQFRIKSFGGPYEKQGFRCRSRAREYFKQSGRAVTMAAKHGRASADCRLHAMFPI